MNEAPERIWIDDERAYGGECHVYTEATEGALEYGTEYVRADLLPVVKPLEWEDLPKPEKGKKQARTIFGHFYSIAGFSDGTWAWYTSFKAAKSGHSGLQACGLTEQEAKDAAQTDHTAQAARLLPQIDPAALVAGAYEAAIRACINMDLLTEHPNDAGSVVLRALTPADAQDALDAAIAKAVNEKLDAVAEYFTQIEKAYYEEATRPMPEHIRRMAAKMNGIARDAQNAILAMKEPE